MKDASATDPAKRLRTNDMYCAMLTQLPGQLSDVEEEDDEDDDLEYAITSLSQRTRTLSASQAHPVVQALQAGSPSNRSLLRRESLHAAGDKATAV